MPISNVGSFEYTVTMKDGEVIGVNTRFAHSYDSKGFMILMPKGEQSNLVINTEEIKMFKWLATK